MFNHSCGQLFETPLTVARQAPLSMELFRQEYWSGLSFPPRGNLLNPGVKPMLLASPALAGGFFTIALTSNVVTFSKVTNNLNTFFCQLTELFCQ